MAYTIQYGPPMKQECAYFKGKKRQRRNAMVLVLLAAFCILGVLFGRAEWMKDILIPGDPEVTKAAFLQFTEDIRQGDRIGDAITAFCREIIDGAQILQ